MICGGLEDEWNVNYVSVGGGKRIDLWFLICLFFVGGIMIFCRIFDWKCWIINDVENGIVIFWCFFFENILMNLCLKYMKIFEGYG